MLYYSTNSKAKIVHSKKCDIYKRIKQKNIKKFKDIHEAHLKGFSMCAKCNPVLKEIFSKNSKCKKYINSPKFKIEKDNDSVIVYTSTDIWKVMPNNSGNCCELFHKNKYISEDTSGVPGYHKQLHVPQEGAEKLFSYIDKHRKYLIKKNKGYKRNGRYKSRQETVRIMYLIRKIEDSRCDGESK